jgi:DNA-binding MarR family transcriptional regulator
MAPGSGQKQTKLSVQQKELLLWIYKQEYERENGVFAKLSREMEELSENILTSWQEQIQEDLHNVMTAFHRSLGTLQPPPRPKKIKGRIKGVEWSAERYLGRKPIKSAQKQESMELARRLVSLENRKLIKRSRRGRYTAYVRLTEEGRALCQQVFDNPASH